MRQRYFLVLDGLRGVAALAVVLFHFMEWVITDFSKNFIGHGYLAVDFFFCLSGFVIAHAYDEKRDTSGIINFFKARLIRLHPLVVIGSALGLIGLFIPSFSQAPRYEFTDVLLLFLCSIFMIPYPVLSEKAFNLFGLNAPAWSLFWEYVINIVYAFWLFRMRPRMHCALLVISALWLMYSSYRYGNLSGGWSKDNWEVGAARVLYSFCAGLFIYRKSLIIQNRGGFALAAVLLLSCFLMPFISLNWLSESFVVLLIFPLIIALGAGTNEERGITKFLKWLGNISYPLYMTHYWSIWIFGDYLGSSYYSENQLIYIIPLGMILLVSFAHLIMVCVDMPIRKYVKNKLTT